MQKQLLFVFIVPFFCFGQKNQIIIDSLHNSLNKTSEKNKALTLIYLSDEYSNFDLGKAFFYSNKSLNQAIKIKNDSIIGLAYNAIANNFQYKTELDSALKYHQKALKIRLKIGDSTGIADTYNNLGIFFDTKGNFSNALKNYFEALYFYEKMDKIDKQAMVCSNIGIVYKANKDFEKAIIYYRKAFDLYQKTNNDFGKTTSAGNLGSILINFKKYDEAIKYSTIAKKGYEKLGYDRFVGYPLSSIAYVQDSLNLVNEANNSYLEAIKLHEKYENNFEIAEVSNSYANFLIKQKKFKQGIEYSEKSLKHAKIAKAYLLEIYNYKNLAKSHSKLGNYHEAFAFFELYNKGMESIFAQDKTKAILELDTKYQTEKKEKQILQQQAQVKQKNLWLLFISGALALGLILFRNFRIQSKLQKEQLKLENKLLEEQSNYKIQEQRLEISRELHDNVGSQLTFIISILDNLKNSPVKFEEAIDKKIDTLSNFASKSIVELRDTIWVLNSKQLNLSELKSRLLNFIKDAKDSVDNSQFHFEFEIKNDNLLSSKQAINSFRVIQEIVNNAIKHAQAKDILVTINHNQTQLEIEISDNGNGFDYEAKKKKSFGLTNIQNRIQELNGELNVQSSAENGTTYNINIPL